MRPTRWTSSRSSASRPRSSPRPSAWSQNDIKKVFAYSTVSQLGYMFLGVRRRRVLGRHLPPDDARVLQGAALPRRRVSVIHALQRRAGHAATWAACARRSRHLRDHDVRRARDRRHSRSLSGFFSKDAILLAAHHHAPWLYWIGVDHRRHDRVLRVPRDVPDVLRRVSRPCSIRTNRRW